MSSPAEVYRFRIIRKGSSWRVESWYSDPPYGPAWASIYSGFTSEDEARTAFVARWHGVTFDTPTTGTFPSQVAS